MRHSRIRGESPSYYHCVSRVVDRRHIFGIAEKEHFVDQMRKLETFLGLRVVTYAVMSNHFHLLIEEPDLAGLTPLTRETLLPHLSHLYSVAQVEEVRQELDRAICSSDPTWERQILDRYERRRGDVSIFMKELKQRFSIWHNRRMGRTGTLWEERYKSVLVEGSPMALMTVAAYIDLNPFRAGLVDRVEDYRWCGYAAAVAGEERARAGLGRILDDSPRVGGEEYERHWESAAPLYRLWLYDQGEERELAGEESPARPVRRGFSREEVEAELRRGGTLTLKQVIRHRVRYLIDGGVLGSAAFVEEVFMRNRKSFGLKRKSGARPMRHADWGNLCVLRDLRRNPVG